MIQVPRPETFSGRRYIWAMTSIVVIVLLLALAVFESINFHWAGMRPDRSLAVAYMTANGAARESGVQLGDRIVQVGGQPVYTRSHLSLVSRAYKVGEPYSLLVERDGQFVSLTLVGKADANISTVLILPLVGVTFLFIGSIVYLFQIRDQASLIFFLTTCALALSYGFAYARSPFLFLLSFAGYVVPSLVVHFFLVFPIHRPCIDKWWLKFLIYAPGVILLLPSVLMSLGWLRIDVFDARAWVEIYQVAGAAVGLALLIYTALTVKRPLVRQQIKWIVWGLSVAVLMNGFFIALEQFDDLRELVDINLINWITLIVPISFAFSIVRYRLFDIDTVINRSIVYVIVVAAVLVLYILSIQIMHSVGLNVYYDNPGFVAILVILLSVLLEPFRRQTQRIVDRVMYRQRPDYRQVMEDLSSEIAATIELDQLIKLLLAHLYRVTKSEHIQVFLLDERQATYRQAAVLGSGGQTQTVAIDHPVVHTLQKQHELLHMPEIVGSRQPAAPENTVEQFMHQEGLVLCLPLRTSDQLLGWLGFGVQRKARLYSLDERRFLLALADQSAVALHNALLYRQSQEQTRQLGILHRIDSILTSTLDLSTLLKNFLVQVVEIFGVEAASVLLRDPDRDVLVFRAAYGPAGGVLPGVTIPLHSRSIASLVVDTGEAIIANDVPTDARWYSEIDRLTQFTTRQLVCVPIVQRDQTVGVIEVLNHRDGTPFTQVDLDMFALLAAQAAMAIENAQLYATTDNALSERVRELGIMQEIDRQLNATLDFEQVMKLTLQWAIKLTRADAGFIGLVTCTDGRQSVDVSAIEGYPAAITSGPLPAGRGSLEQLLAGANVINEGQIAGQDEGWPLRPATRSRLIAPVMREERVIGIVNLEADRAHHFGAQDETLIGRLTDHAAIAMENASLYQMVRLANESKTEFVNLVAHELKAPMTIIKGFSELLNINFAESLGEEARIVRIIVVNVERMQALISELLQLAQLESHVITLDRCPDSMHTILAEVITSLHKMIDEYGTSISLDVPETLPLVYADQTRLAEILTNLISNAIKYTPKGRAVTVRAEPYVEAAGQQDGRSFVRCLVQDQGIGISEEDQQRLFSRFFRAPHPYVRKQPGTGLGLSITKMLVELHEGEIGFSSQPEHGSTFWFTVPVAEFPR